MRITIPESLGISALGLIVVFIVLVFLMCITYIMAAIFRGRAKKTVTAAAESSAQQGSTSADGAVDGVTGETVGEASTGSQEEAPETPVAKDEVPEIEKSAPEPPAGDSAVSAVTPSAVTNQADDVHAAVPTEKTTMKQPKAVRKQYNVVLNGVTLDVEAEITNMQSGVRR